MEMICSCFKEKDTLNPPGSIEMLMLWSVGNISIFITFCLFTSRNSRPFLHAVSKSEQNRRKNTPKTRQASIICTHSTWKLKVIFRISGLKLFSTEKKRKQTIEENQCVCVYTQVGGWLCVYIRVCGVIASLSHPFYPLPLYAFQ